MSVNPTSSPSDRQEPLDSEPKSNVLNQRVLLADEKLTLHPSDSCGVPNFNALPLTDSDPETNSTSSVATLSDKLGGSEAIRQTVDAFYDRVLGVEQLASFFAKTNMDWLKKSQIALFSQALGGPQKYEGKDMKSAHRRLSIQQKHFDIVAGHLVGALRSLDVPTT